MAIYATGTTGTIGRHLSSFIDAIKVDFLDPEFAIKLPNFTSDDSLIHLGGIVGADLVASDLHKSHTVNVEATEKIAQRFILNNGGFFIYVSSSHVYSPSAEKINEDSKLAPQNNYAQQKLEAEQLLQALFWQVPQKLCIVRVFSVLDWDTPPLTLGGGIAKLADNNSTYQLTCSDDIRDFLTPRKIAQILEKIAKSRGMRGVVNLCSGTGISVGDAARVMLESRKFRVPPGRVVRGNSKVPHLVGDNSKLREMIPNIDLEWSPSGQSEI
jgi:nucleoside-diphosphate-sugar epimerase